ncbi:hypothetical protein SKAU_G00017780 [Synaphobranchus kaupii]|uniref:Uncharacterized protein n=1 Tax=Synaphobranchus kaupii TaxID=118154 RepID=A0A9Q1JDK6_SYNKA|nr:hypothetical protein SKAU_G00017780 [Synaphobranchus kaupii]
MNAAPRAVGGTSPLRLAGGSEHFLPTQHAASFAGRLSPASQAREQRFLDKAVAQRRILLAANSEKRRRLLSFLRRSPWIMSLSAYSSLLMALGLRRKQGDWWAMTSCIQE